MQTKKAADPCPDDQLKALVEYRRILDEGYCEPRANHRTLHKRSVMHNNESMDSYYQRWLNLFSKELRSLDVVIYKLVHPATPCTLQILHVNN